MENYASFGWNQPVVLPKAGVDGGEQVKRDLGVLEQQQPQTQLRVPSDSKSSLLSVLFSIILFAL